MGVIAVVIGVGMGMIVGSWVSVGDGNGVGPAVGSGASVGVASGASFGLASDMSLISKVGIIALSSKAGEDDLESSIRGMSLFTMKITAEENAIEHSNNKINVEIRTISVNLLYQLDFLLSRLATLYILPRCNANIDYCSMNKLYGKE